MQCVVIHVKNTLNPPCLGQTTTPAIVHCPFPWNIGTILTSHRLSTGAMLESHPAEGETPAFKGSMMLAMAVDEAEVRAILENDIYAHSGVWDLSKAQIIPVRYVALPSLTFWHFVLWIVVVFSLRVFRSVLCLRVMWERVDGTRGSTGVQSTADANLFFGCSLSRPYGRSCNFAIR